MRACGVFNDLLILMILTVFDLIISSLCMCLLLSINFIVLFIDYLDSLSFPYSMFSFNSPLSSLVLSFFVFFSYTNHYPPFSSLLIPLFSSPLLYSHLLSSHLLSSIISSSPLLFSFNIVSSFLLLSSSPLLFLIIPSSSLLLLSSPIFYRCEALYHLKCLDPPITVHPRVEWYCPSCIEQKG